MTYKSFKLRHFSFLLLLIVIIFIILINHNKSQDNKGLEYINSETEAISQIIPNDWEISHIKNNNNQIIKTKISSNKECLREFLLKPNPEPQTESIKPSITIAYQDRWDEEDYVTINNQQSACEEEIAARPMIAISCDISRTKPIINTKNHSIFITEQQCQKETLELKTKLLDYFKQYQ